MTWTAFIAAVLALLVTPGPTNTLLFLAGSERGWRGALRLIPVEMAAYLCVVVPLSVVGGQVLSALPGARPVISVVAGLWVGALAWRLWRPPGQADARRAVSARTVLVTTMLNPKALVFGLVLVPATAAPPVALAGFATMVAAVAAGWAAAGALAAGPGTTPGRRIVWVRRGSALWLAALSVGLLARGLAAGP